jgi:hypothetical protein
MPDKPFFLYPAYASLLDSPEALRRRYCERQRIKTTAQQMPFVLMMLFCTVMPLVFGTAILSGALDARPPRPTVYTGIPDPPAPPPRPGLKYFAIAVMAAGPVMLGVLLLNLRAERRRYRLAWEGKLVAGTIDSCTGDEYLTETESDPLENRPYTQVLVQYSFDGPSNKRLQGRASVNRDDLRTETLPQPGTPVRVLVLDDRTFAML